MKLELSQEDAEMLAYYLSASCLVDGYEIANRVAEEASCGNKLGQNACNVRLKIMKLLAEKRREICKRKGETMSETTGLPKEKILQEKIPQTNSNTTCPYCGVELYANLNNNWWKVGYQNTWYYDCPKCEKKIEVRVIVRPNFDIRKGKNE